MTKLLQNKPLIKFLGIALSILLVVALVPQISIAYGSKDDIADEAVLAETGDDAATEGEEVATDGEEAATSEEGTLKSDIKVTGGATLTIKGSGTIIGYGEKGQGSVIVVEGKGSKLVFGEIKDGVSSGPTVTGGTGRSIPNKNKWVIWNEVGGGIHVCRAQGNNEEKNASLEFRGGTVSGNTAEAGGGIFIDYRCGFTMSGGSVLNNTATKHEGGGIFTWGNWNGKTGTASRGYGEITAATIKGNKTATTTDWGGGGIYINNDGVLRIESARITGNTAKSLGGGVAGCPHAEIGIGKK